MKQSIWKKKGYIWVTLVIFLISFSLHWYFGWEVFKTEQLAHNQPIDSSEYLHQILRDTMENWQSEFLQLMWQVAGLSFLWYVGSPQSKESDERKEEKIDKILQSVNPEEYDKIIKDLNNKYPKK